MEHIEMLFSLAHDNILLVFLIAILATFLESFIPALPLIAIVIMNAMLLGFFGGLISSTIGSCMGTTLLFLLSKKFSYLKYFDKVKNYKTDKIINLINKQNYIVLYLCYCSIFIPGCLITISLGFAGRSLKNFLPGMVLGKMTIFAIASYIGYDIKGLIHNPIKILIILCIMIVLFFVGKKISSKISNNQTINV